MSERPLIIGLLLGLVVVLLIAGVSLVITKSALNQSYKEAVEKSMKLEETVENIKGRGASLEAENVKLQKVLSDTKNETVGLATKVEQLQMEVVKEKKYSEKLADNLKEALVQKDSQAQGEAKPQEQPQPGEQPKEQQPVQENVLQSEPIVVPVPLVQ